MKKTVSANNGQGNTPLRDEWITPSRVFDPINEQYEFNTDCCGSAENAKCGHYYSKAVRFESFSLHIDSVSWMNPPFSIAQKMFKTFFKRVKKGIAIYRCDNLETKIWQKLIFYNADWVFFLNRRVNFEGFGGAGARFPSALIGYHLPPPLNIKGTLLFIPKKIGGNNEENREF